MSPRNVQFAPELVRMFPRMRLVYTVRDGRDVACSLAGLPFGPETSLEALERWDRHLRRADASVRHSPRTACTPCSSRSSCSRDASNCSPRCSSSSSSTRTWDPPCVRLRADGRERHLGRWRTELAGGERDELDRQYRDVLAAMAADGVASRPDPDPLPADYAAVPAASGSAIDPWADGRAERA